jgi:multiple sugar transport system permease protein
VGGCPALSSVGLVPVKTLLGLICAKMLIGLGLVDSHVDFLSTKALAMPSVIVATFWRGFPFWVISFLAALQSVPPELYEAAAIDGAGAWQRFQRVTLPSIRHVVLVVLLLSTIWTTNGFENV